MHYLHVAKAAWIIYCYMQSLECSPFQNRILTYVLLVMQFLNLRIPFYLSKSSWNSWGRKETQKPRLSMLESETKRHRQFSFLNKSERWFHQLSFPISFEQKQTVQYDHQLQIFINSIENPSLVRSILNIQSSGTSTILIVKASFN